MKKFITKMAVASTIVLAACSGQMDESTTEDDISPETSMKSATTIVATVNNETITQGQVDERTALITQGQGQVPTDGVALNQLIDEMLVFQDAAAKGIAVTEEELDAQYDVVVQNAGGAELLKSQLSQLNISPAALRKDLETQILIQKYLESEVNVEDIEVTDAEVQKAYDDIAAVQEVPPMDDAIRAQIREQLVLQKKNERALAHVQSLRAAATIELSMNDDAADMMDTEEETMEEDAMMEGETGNE